MRGAVSRFLVIAAAFAFGSSACTLAVSTSGLFGGGGDGGGEPRDDAAASTLDGGEAGAAPPAAARCPANALLCDDFETATIAPAWTTTPTSGGTVTLVPGLGRGRSLRARLSASELEFGTAFLERKNLATITRNVTLRAGFRLLKPAPERPCHIATFVLNASAERYHLIIAYLNGGNISVAEFVCPEGNCEFLSTPTPNAPITDDGWHEMVLSLDLSPPSPARMTFSYEGGSATKLSELGVVGGTLDVRMGIVLVDAPYPEVEVAFDDVVVTGE